MIRKVLLVNPPVYDFAAYDLWMKPWGLLKISAVLKKMGYEVFLADAMDRHHRLFLGRGIIDKPDGTGKFFSMEVEKPPALKGVPRRYRRYGLPSELFDKALPSGKVDIILVSSGMTYWYPGVFDAIRALKKRYSCPVVLGGVYATLCHEHAVRESGADHVVKNGDFARLSGILGAWSDISFCDILGETIDLSGYIYSPYAVLRVSLGCPFDCAYCAQKILSPPFSLKSMDGALREVQALYEAGIRNFAFYDDALLYHGEYAKKYFSALIDSGIKACFYSPNGLHARFLDEHTARLMKGMNFVNPILSLEVSNDKKAGSFHDKVTRKELIRAVENLKKAGYLAGEYSVYLILGLPGTGYRDVEESMEFAYSLGARISLSEFSPVPGTSAAREIRIESLDPLLQNNSVLLCQEPSSRDKIRQLKDMANKLNYLIKEKTPPQSLFPSVYR